MTIKQTESPLRDRFDFLDDAKVKVADRGEQYGSIADNFGKTAAIWSAILGIEVTPAQVGLCMAGLKISRLTYDPQSEDGWVDLAGYAACGGEVTRQDDV
jgi:hypothetical protein